MSTTAPASASGTALVLVLVLVLKVTCACASLILQFFSLLVLVQTTSISQTNSILISFLSTVVTASSTSSTFSGSPFLNARRPHGECSPAHLAVLICPLAQDAHKDKHHRHSHHSHLRDTQGPWTKLAPTATETAEGSAAILESYQPTPTVERKLARVTRPNKTHPSSISTSPHFVRVRLHCATPPP